MPHHTQLTKRQPSHCQDSWNRPSGILGSTLWVDTHSSYDFDYTRGRGSPAYNPTSMPTSMPTQLMAIVDSRFETTFMPALVGGRYGSSRLHRFHHHYLLHCCPAPTNPICPFATTTDHHHHHCQYRHRQYHHHHKQQLHHNNPSTHHNHNHLHQPHHNLSPLPLPPPPAHHHLGDVTPPHPTPHHPILPTPHTNPPVPLPSSCWQCVGCVGAGGGCFASQEKGDGSCQICL